MEQHFENRQIIILVLVSFFILFGTHFLAFSFFAFLICIYVIVFIQGEFALALIVYTMSFAYIFKISAQNMSYFTFVVLLYVIIKMLKVGEVPIAGTVFAIYVVLVQSSVGVFSVREDLKLIGNIFFLYYAFEESRKYDGKRVFMCYILGVIIAASMRFLDSSFFQITAYAGATEINYFGEDAAIKSITRFAGIYQDANYFGVNVILALCILLIMYGKKYLSLLSTSILVSPLLYFSIETGSKSVLFMSILPFMVFIAANHKNKKYYTQVIFGVGIIGFIYMLMTGEIHFLDAVFQRLEGKNLSDPNALTTGRFDVWMKEIQFFFKNPISFLIGVGVGNFKDQVWAHNAYLETVKYVGLVGISMLYWSFKEVYNKRFYMKRLMNISGLATVLIMYFFLNQFYGYEFPIHFLLAFMILDIDFENEREVCE